MQLPAGGAFKGMKAVALSSLKLNHTCQPQPLEDF